MAESKRVLYAVLNWGLGHATRSIPIIKVLEAHGFEPVLASDGAALAFLDSTFPHLEKTEFPTFDLNYRESRSQLWAILGQTGKILKWHHREAEFIERHFAKNAYAGVISDNRPAVFCSAVPSVYVTHQLQVKSGFVSALATGVHRHLYQKFTEVWVPDVAAPASLAGYLSKASAKNQLRFIGPLSDLSPVQRTPDFDCAVILSGLEPQRTSLEIELIAQLGAMPEKRVLFVRGTRGERPKGLPAQWQILDVASRSEIQEAFARSRVIIARNGYSTLMDLATFSKPALLIPTPGQPEQEYLATLPIHKNKFAVMHMHNLDVKAGLDEALAKFRPHQNAEMAKPDWDQLFGLFEGK